MSLNKQVPYLYTLLGASSNVLTLSNAKAVSCLASGGVVTIQNGQSQSMNLEDGTTIELQADSGNTLDNIIITPSAGATAYVTMIGGNGVVTP